MTKVYLFGLEHEGEVEFDETKGYHWDEANDYEEVFETTDGRIIAFEDPIGSYVQIWHV